jgi:hypothetical protein
MFNETLYTMNDNSSKRTKIKTLDEFKRYSSCEGYIILVNYREAIIHKSKCSYLNEKKFENSKKEYLWFTELDEIENELENTRSCRACNPFD